MSWPWFIPWFGFTEGYCEEDGTPSPLVTKYVFEGLTFEWLGWCLLIHGYIYEAAE